jgi:PAS domain S-box-containing protein
VSDGEQEISGPAGLLAAVVNSSFDAIISETLDGTITSWNPAATRLFGYGPGEMIGQSIRRLIPAGRQDEEDQILAKIKAGERVEPYETVRLHKNGDPIDVFLTSSPIWGADGKIAGASKIIRDITLQKKAAETLRQSEERLRRFVKRTEAALRESEERLKFALDAAGAGTWEVSLDTGELTASDRTLSFHGIPACTPVTHESTLARLHPDDRPRVDEALRRTLETGEPLRMECRNLIADGSERWLEARGERRSIAGKQIIGGLVLDITDRKRAEEALRQSEEWLRLALKGSGAAAWQWKFGSEKQTWSPESYVLHGRDPKLGPPDYNGWLSCLHPGDRARIDKVVFDAIEKRSPEYRAEYRVVLPSGEVRWLDALGKIDYAADGAPLRISGLNLDITERKGAEEARRKAEELERQKREELETVLAALPVAVVIAKDAGCVEMTGNRAAYQLLRLPSQIGLSKSAAPGQAPNSFEVFSKGRQLSTRELPVQKAAATKTPVLAEELELHFVEGGSSVVLCNALPLFDDAGEVRGAVGVFTDITGLKHTEAALRESEERLRFALEAARVASSNLEAALSSMTDAVFISDTDGNFVHFNEAFATFHKFKSKDDCAKTFAEYPEFLSFYLPGGELAPPHEWPSRRALRGETGMLAEYTIKQRNGKTYVASYNFAPIRNSSGEIAGAVVTARDITDQKRAEKQLREGEARLKSIIDTASDSIIVLDEKGIIQSVNRATANIFGYSPEELIGQHVNFLMPQEFRKQHRGYLKEFAGAARIEDMEAQRKDGTLVALDLGLAEWRDDEGRRFFTAIFRDITERKRNEEALANARRLEATGQLAGGVAHDFNNLLSVIAGNLELAEARVRDQTARDLMRRALDAAEQGSGLNRRLLSLARKRTLKPQRLILNCRVKETAKLLTSTLGEHIAVTTDLAPDPWMTLADAGEIDSAILNIAANARDAMPGGGTIRITTLNVTLDVRAAAKLHVDAKAGDYVRLAIADNGSGMPQKVLDKAMEPFFTTKESGAGTGLGLTSVASFARQTGGFATIASASNCGCVVSLYLPRAAEAQPAPEAVRPGPAPLGDGELVLVVEDDRHVREVTLKRIESLGYAVEEARNGPEAIELIKSGAPISLVLSDIVMPGGLTGYDVARWVASNKPEIKVILCSGYNEGDHSGDVADAIPDVIFLGKPYGRDKLACALSEALALSRTR